MKPYAQLLYDELFKTSQRIGVDTYAEKPMSDVAYPFVYIRNVDTSMRPLKRLVYGVYNANIEVFSDERSIGNTIVNDLLKEMLHVHTEHITFQMRMQETNVREFEEQLDNQQTIHYFLIEATYQNL